MKNLFTKDIVLTVVIGFLAGTSAGILVMQLHKFDDSMHEGQVAAHEFMDTPEPNTNQNVYMSDHTNVYSDFQSEMPPADLYDAPPSDLMDEEPERFQNI